MVGKAKRVALYLRVSTDGQTVENQRRELDAVAARRGWTVVQTFEDAGVSGTTGRDKRPGFDGMMKDAARARFDLVAVWSIDRLGRSTATVAAAMAELSDLGVGLYADREGMDSGTAHGRAMLQMAAVFGQLERDMIVERVRAGMARAKAEQAAGKVRRDAAGNVKLAIGRPRISGDTEATIRARLQGGEGILKVAKAAGVGTGTVQRIRAEMAAAA